MARSAVVVGGGIAGPVTAMALQRAGIEASVHEAHPGPADGIGGGLNIAPNGLAALAAIGADEAVRRIGAPMTSIVLHSWTGRRLAEVADPPDLPVSRFVWRPELYRALYDEAVSRGVRIHHSRRLVAVAETPDGVTARFADGSEVTADVLVGADGIRSTVRALIDPGAPAPRYCGLLNFGAVLPETGLPPTGDRMHMVFGKRAFLGYQVDADGGGGWFVNLPHRDPATAAQVRGVPAQEWLERLRAALAGDRGPGPDLLRRTDPADLLVIGPVEDLPTVPVWSRGRAVLVGDAAHATSPSSGQGASQAAESAVQLARCLRDLPVGAAFAEYERLRRARVERVIAAGARTSSAKAAGPVGRVLRDLLMPVAMRAFASPERMRWQTGHRIDFDAPVVPAQREPAGRR
ncbi:FAD-dependent monooxygenase [Kineococcus glutinatus]|uniref:FAD-dependent monooxygenase n=2 Tax=Kineococcus glutinatus TaxID=1070872 RepID=A0ABP9H9B3_9ACTN